MPELVNYKNFFNKSDSVRALVQKMQNNFIWEEDKKVAKYFGTGKIYLIAIIHNRGLSWVESGPTRPGSGPTRVGLGQIKPGSGQTRVRKNPGRVRSQVVA